MISQLTTFVSEHGTATAGMAIVHFAHLAWPRLVAIFPYCRDNGGAVGIAKQFLFGRQIAAAISPGSAGVSPAAAPTQPATQLKEVV